MDMTPWERVDRELALKRTSWATLGKFLGAEKQTVGHWKTRGIPAKYYRPIATYFNKPTDWTELGDASGQDDGPKLAGEPATSAAMEIALLFDMIPVGDRIRRTQAYNAATKAILDILEGPPSTRPAAHRP